MYLNIVYHLLGVAVLEAKLKDPNLTEAANKNYLLSWLGIRSIDVIMKNSLFPFFDKAYVSEPFMEHRYKYSSTCCNHGGKKTISFV